MSEQGSWVDPLDFLIDDPVFGFGKRILENKRVAIVRIPRDDFHNFFETTGAQMVDVFAFLDADTQTYSTRVRHPALPIVEDGNEIPILTLAEFKSLISPQECKLESAPNAPTRSEGDRAMDFFKRSAHDR